MPNVVELQRLESGIAQITMQDRENKNTFSVEMVNGLCAAFSEAKQDSTLKVIVLTGYDTYFSSGGTRDALLALSAGSAKFTDTDIYNLPLECPIPVIAAMQGHAIGGGFVFGLFADIVILSRESVYTTNFMRYGFTPGMGATLIVPTKLGAALGHELLFAARNYRGAELERRGVPFVVAPRAEVLARASELARDLADKPRASLTTLKNHLVAPLRTQLPSVIERELAMHELTFHQPEVRARIAAMYGQ